MLVLDSSIDPNPFHPVALDAYGHAPMFRQRPGSPDLEVVTPARQDACIVAWLDDLSFEHAEIGFFWLGVYQKMPVGRFPIFLRSAGLMPQGRMVKPSKVAP
jgi:hypothetical protein